jgi:DNA-binding transcriptional MerR regulator
MAGRKGSSGDSKKRAAGRSKKETASVAAETSSEAAGEGKLYYRIGEVSKLTDVKAHVLRYWETEFRWMAPPKSRSKQRLYRQKDIETILTIKRLLYDERYTIAGAKQQLRELGMKRGAARGKKAAVKAVASGDPVAPKRKKRAGGTPESFEESYRQLRVELQEIRSLL